jgi:uncharacterized membrane protein YfcA
MAVHLSRRRLRALPILLMIAAGLPAAYLGSSLALHLPDGLAARIFGIFLVFAGIPALRSVKSKKEMKKS